MKKVLLFISMLLAAVLITGLYSCTENGGENDNRHRRGGEESPEEICLKFDQVIDDVDIFYDQCKSMEELRVFLPEIKEVRNVEDAYISDRYLYIKIKGYGTMSYSYIDDEEDEVISAQNDQLYHGLTRAELDRSYINPEYALENAVVSNQEYDQRMSMRVVAEDALKLLRFAGIDAQPNNSPDIDFFKNQIFGYDIIFHIGHGSYDDNEKIHWFLTLQEIHNFDEELDLINTYPTDQVSVNRHNGKKVAKISEKFIETSEKEFGKKGKTIFFSVPCESLNGKENILIDHNKQDYSFADAFTANGLGLYLGYDERNNVGHNAGLLFLGNLVSGMTVENSFKRLPYSYLHNVMDQGDWSYTADLFPSYYDKNHSIANSTLTMPVINEVESIETNDGRMLRLKATAILYREPYNYNDEYKIYQKYIDGFNYSDFTYGYEISESSNFNNSTQISKTPVGTDLSETKERCLYNKNLVTFTKLYSLDNLKPETKYYIRAFFNDGTINNYSKAKEFTTPEQERIDQVIPEDVRKKMEPFIPIYDGNNPPTIEGVFVIDSPEVVHDTTNNYKKGDTGFTPIYMRFLNQDVMNNTLDYEERDVYNGKVVGESSGPGAFISGEGNNFSVFFSTTGVNHYDKYDISVKTSLVISGTKTDSGIKDVRYAFVLTDKGPDPDHHVMDKDGFRVFKDSDDLASKASWPSGARRWGWDYKVKDGKITTPWSIYAVKK